MYHKRHQDNAVSQDISVFMRTGHYSEEVLHRSSVGAVRDQLQ
jgi:hypothetical protein